MILFFFLHISFKNVCVKAARWLACSACLHANRRNLP